MFEQRRWLKILVIVLCAIIGAVILFIGAVFAYNKTFENKVFYGVYLGDYHLQGMTEAEVANFITKFNSRITKEGINFKYVDKDKGTINISVDTVLQSQDGFIDLIKLDGSALSKKAIGIGREKTGTLNKFLNPLKLFVKKQQISTSIDIKTEFTKSLKEKTKTLTNDVKDANIKVGSVKPLEYEEVSEVSGTYFDYDAIIKNLSDNLSKLSLSTIEIKRKQFAPNIKKTDLLLIKDKVDDIFADGNISLSYVDNATKQKKEWNILPTIYKNWLVVAKDKENNLIFDLNKKSVETYLDSIKKDVENIPQEAKFEMENGVVKKFQVSESGIAIDKDKTYSDISKVFRQRNYDDVEQLKTINLSVKITEPEMKMSDVNNLGISSIIGTGVSTFKNSHTNRIKNIANAVKRLNGLLIKPDEIFSTNKGAGPYIVENGYLPEEVIVGDRIKIEVGGGMCQIGTTLFRTAMNSAMPITQRQNHSLVVQYYADPVNNNPGTDATVYEPYVDFRFKNDTGSYLLLQTSIDYTKEEITFTLWGKNDGRKGSYTHPVVSKWYQPGEKIIRKTTELEEGVEKCQNSFTGASASFTYTRITSSSEKIDRVFESYYTPLPKICMVGVSQKDYCIENPNVATCKDFDYSASTTIKIE